MPTLIIVGDEDEPCVPNAGLLVVLVVLGTGHTVNIEEPGLFNIHVADFLARVERVSAPRA